MTQVALSGAGGTLGRFIRLELQKRGIDLRSAGGRNPLVPLHEGEDIMHSDLRDPAVVDRLLNDIDVLIHLAGISDGQLGRPPDGRGCATGFAKMAAREVKPSRAWSLLSCEHPNAYNA